MTERQKFEAAGRPLAIDVRALDLMWTTEAVSRPDFELRGDVAVVCADGPLEHHEGCFQSYDELKRRLQAAFDSPAKCVLLSLDSPGGVVSGCFDTAREVRAMADRSGKRFYAYADGQLSSAAYAFALSADRVIAPPAAVVGSIGVMAAVADTSALDAAMGIRWHLLRSGTAKALTAPHSKIDEVAIAKAQELIDGLAEQFYAWVSERRGIPVDAVRSLEGAEFLGADAIGLKLIDALGGEDDSLAMLASDGENPAESPAATGDDMADMSSVKAALRALAEEGDEEAKKMLASSEEPDGDEDEKAEGEKHDEPDGDEPKGEADEPNKEDKQDEENRAKATSSALASLNTKLAEVHKMAAKSALAVAVSKRPDIQANADLMATLRKLPLEQAEAIIAATPVTTGPVAAARAALGVSNPLVANNKTESINPAGIPDDMAARFGILKTSANLPRMQGTQRVYDVSLTSAQAKARLAEINGGAK